MFPGCTTPYLTKMRFSVGVLTPLLGHLALGVASDGGGNALARFALDKILQEGRDIFGDFDESASSSSPPTTTITTITTSFSEVFTHGYSRHSRWMAALPDSMPLTHLNIPGTHDAATWNYSQPTQDGLANATRCDGTVPRPARVYRCQRRGIGASLEAGIRFFDLRFALDPLDARLAFWHGPALLSAAATVEDVLFALYGWLDAHPSEMVLLSLQYEGGTRANATSDARVQRKLFDALTSPAARRYVHQGRGVLGTLGDVRGKVVLFRRFDLDRLPPAFEAAMPGLHMAPGRWLDNSKSGFELVYNDTIANGSAFVEDYYHPDDYDTVAGNVDAKFDAVRTHLRQAAGGDLDHLFVTFTSGTHVEIDPPVYPDVMALGSAGGGSGDMGPPPPPAAVVPGINRRLLELLGEMKGERLGVVVMDFFEEPEGLVDLLLDF
ncbi:PLC-like phosphodiesterase [Xylaria castorea]|nr:PLC-like phosphodiesterase [Xylaria castorea]